MASAVAAINASQWSVRNNDFSMHLDESGIIRVKAIGYWKVESVDRYFLALGKVMSEARRRNGKALVLVDKRDAPLQSADVVERLSAGCLTHYRPADRLAVVVSTCLAKLQVKRVLPPDRTSAFVSIPAAEHYLLTN